MSKILIVDDEPFIVKIVKDRLESDGFEIIIAIDGEAALAAAKKETPDLILLDIMLPKMDGYSVCRLLKFDAKYKDIPIVMITAKAAPEDQSMAAEVRADGFIKKPINFDELTAIVNKFIKK